MYIFSVISIALVNGLYLASVALRQAPPLRLRQRLQDLLIGTGTTEVLRL